MKPILLYTTFANLQAAEEVCAVLLQEQLIACANIGAPMLSLYKWQGATEKSQEIPVWLKTSAERESVLYQRLSEIHPYDVPCIMTLTVENISVAYAGWLQQCLQ